jgi:hypothetical protein
MVVLVGMAQWDKNRTHWPETHQAPIGPEKSVFRKMTFRAKMPHSENADSQALGDFRGQKITSELRVTRAKYRRVAPGA